MTADVEVSAAVPAAAGLVVEDRFAIVPEWLLDADISDAAIRLYAVLLRYGQTSGARMPGRATLARRLHKKSTDSVDRAMHELEQIGAVHVEHRYAGGQRLTNLYHLKATRGVSPFAAAVEGGSRKSAATPSHLPELPNVAPVGGGRTDAARGSRTDAAGVAANLRPNPEPLTQTQTSSPAADHDDGDQTGERLVSGNPWREEEDRFLNTLGITDMHAFVADVEALRTDAGAPTGRWSRPPLVAALQTAVRARGWPENTAAAALKAVAADPATRSPMRLAEAGPWWDVTPIAMPPDGESIEGEDPAEGRNDQIPLEDAEAELVEADGLRILLQRRAREQLTAEGIPLTRITVLRRAHQLLLATREREGATC
ncbi:hypothetical protein acdb102_22790 [Acidothermaceae bacterium B102]|nr:hypothetical protein acdb102_22790 [Acidothermaceae bacterium B102]